MGCADNLSLRVHGHLAGDMDDARSGGHGDVDDLGDLQDSGGSRRSVIMAPSFTDLGRALMRCAHADSVLVLMVPGPATSRSRSKL